MLTRSRRVMSSLVALLAGLSAMVACDSAPGDDLFAIGIARIGDSYHLLIPMCGDESLTGLKVTRSPNPEVGGIADTGDPAFTYWSVTGPEEPAARAGLLLLGADDAWTTVTVPAGAQTDLPAFIAVIADGASPDGSFVKSAGTFLTSAPVNAAGTDPNAAMFGWNSGKEIERLSVDEIRQRSGCARQYP